MTEDEKKKAERYKLQIGKWGMYVHDTLTGSDIDMEQVRDRLNSAPLPAKVDGDEVGEPPCGDRCPKDEDCDNYGIGGEPCPHATTSQQGREWTEDDLAQIAEDEYERFAGQQTAAAYKSMIRITIRALAKGIIRVKS